MSITLSSYSGSLTVGATETSFVAGAVGSGTATTTGVVQGNIDLHNLTGVAKYELKVKRAVTSTSTKGVCHYELLGPDSNEPMYILPSVVVGHFWDITLKNVGTTTDVAIPYSIDVVG